MTDFPGECPECGHLDYCSTCSTCGACLENSIKAKDEELEKFKECLSALLYWNDRCDHIDQSWWDEAECLLKVLEAEKE